MDTSEVALRRLNRLAAHIAASSQSSCSSSLATMVCSSDSSIHAGCGRRESRLLYARPGFHTPSYTRDSKDDQVSTSAVHGRSSQRRHNRILFARQGSITQAFYMRGSSDFEVKLPKQKEEPSLESKIPELDQFSSQFISHSKGKEGDGNPVDGEPMFARIVASSELDKTKLQSSDAKRTVCEIGWHPRMDIVEARAAYVVIIELPGLSPDGIRVEVNNNGLLVSGTRPMKGHADDHMQGEELYHLREISQGPFKVQWPIPKNTNIDGTSAEFIDGFLRVLVPKIMSP